jgi:hypothetical protein
MSHSSTSLRGSRTSGTETIEDRTPIAGIWTETGRGGGVGVGVDVGVGVTVGVGSDVAVGAAVGVLVLSGTDKGAIPRAVRN